MSKRIIYILVFLLFFETSCGIGESVSDDDVPTGLPPTVASIDPTAGQVNSQITIYGFGFSDIPENNIVIIGGSGVSATNYELLPNPTPEEIEAITATVPSQAALGLDSVVVVVNDNPSNSDITFTVVP